MEIHFSSDRSGGSDKRSSSAAASVADVTSARFCGFKKPSSTARSNNANLQLGETAMGDFPIDESARDHANDLTASRQHRVGKQAHEADAGAAIHHRNPAPDKLRRKLDGRDTMFIA